MFILWMLMWSNLYIDNKSRKSYHIDLHRLNLYILQILGYLKINLPETNQCTELVIGLVPYPGSKYKCLSSGPIPFLKCLDKS